MPKPTEHELYERFKIPSGLEHTGAGNVAAYYMQLAVSMTMNMPESRKLSIALTELETSYLWAMSAFR